MKNAVYFQSGGPTSVINSSFYGVIKGVKESGGRIEKIYGARYGLEGLLTQDLVECDMSLLEYECLKSMPGAVLGSARLQLGENENVDERYSKVLECVKKFDIGYIFVNGGNDSMDTANKLNKFFDSINYDCKVLGIPKTIDNDLVGLDHAPGFASCAQYIIRTCMEMSMDINSYKKGRVTILETMGRDTGWLAASSKVACKYGLGPDLIYVPESCFDVDKFLKDVEDIYKKQGHAFVVVSEALKDKDGNYVSAAKDLDSFGHVQLGAISKYLADLVKEKLGINTRNIELSLTQRCASHISSSIDVNEAILVGCKAVEYALEGKCGMVTIQRDKDNHMSYPLDELSKTANGIQHLDPSYINEEGNNITDAYVDYVTPLIDENYIAIAKGRMFI